MSRRLADKLSLMIEVFRPSSARRKRKAGGTRRWRTPNPLSDPMPLRGSNQLLGRKLFLEQDHEIGGPKHRGGFNNYNLSHADMVLQYKLTACILM